LQKELAEEKSLHSRKSRREYTKSTSRKKKFVTLNVIKSFVCRPEIGPKHFDKLKPEARSDPKSPARLTTLVRSRIYAHRSL